MIRRRFMRGYYMLSFLRMRRHRALLTIVLLLGSVLGAHAHPHIWIDAYVDLNLGPDGLETIDVRWVFDPFFTGAVMVDLDTNGNGRIDEAEQQILYRNMFEGMADIDYFFMIEAGERRVRPENPQAFSAQIVDGKLEYRFRLSVAVEWGHLDGLRIAAFDDSYYTDFATRVGGQTGYFHSGNVVRVSQTSRQMETLDWGWVQLPVVELVVN